MLYQIRVPHSDGILDRDLAHEQTIHPAKAELYKLDAFVLQVFCQAIIDTRSKIAQACHLSLDSWLVRNIVVLYPVQKLRQTPERVSFDGVKHLLRKLPRIHPKLNVGIRDVGAKEDLPEGGDEIVDALHVARSGMPYRPDVQYSFQRSLCGFVAVQFKMWVRAGNVDADLMPDGFVQTSTSPANGGRER